MTVGLNASQARAKSNQDMIIFDETQAIMKAIIEASASGLYNAVVDDDTTMTTSTPTVELVGTVNRPTITPSSDISINGYVLALGVTSTNLNGVISDINDGNIPGVSASKRDGFLVLSMELPAAITWTYTVGNGTANADLGLVAGTYTASLPASTDYFDCWQGTNTDRAKVSQMDAVIRHFANLGYKIERLTNTSTNSTFAWNINW